MLVDTHLEGGILTVRLNRPDKRNALSTALGGAMAAAFTAFRDDDGVAIAVLTGAGDRAFASGGDLAELSAVRTLAAATAMSAQFRAAFDTVRTFPVPVIAALNGDALGGGAELALACDIRIAAPHARIGFLQGRLALSTAWGGGSDLIATVGMARALRLLGRAEILSASAAHAEGLIDAVGAPDQPFDGFVADYVAGFAARTPGVMRAFKALASASRSGAGRDAMNRIETDHFARNWVHDDHWAAVAASLGKAGKE